MATVLPSRGKSTVALAFELMAAEERSAKKVKKEPEPAAPVKAETTNKRKAKR